MSAPRSQPLDRPPTARGPIHALRAAASVVGAVVMSGPVLVACALAAYVELSACDELGIDPVEGL